MTTEDAFAAAITGYALLCAYVNTIAQEIGMERAIALLTRMSESVGARQGGMFKEQSGRKDFDAQATWSYAKSTKDRLGNTYEVVDKSPQRVVIRNHRCAIYEAARSSGMDAEAIETFCRATPMRLMERAIKQLNPNLNLRITKFRSTPDDFCEEEIALD